jgi:dihydrofolate reductase
MPAEQGPRRVVLQMGVSLDAIAAIPRGNGTMPVMEGQWGLPPEPPELTDLKLAWLREADAHLMGRVTYEAMAGYWPMSTHPYAALMNDIPKVVFSRTLDRADWPDSQIARGDIADEVARLKREPGKDLIAHGGASFAQSLARHNLIDEYRLMIHPVAIGSGLPVFKDLTTPLRLELIDARTFGGTSVRVYARA